MATKRSNSLISVDLDWFNGAARPIARLRKILSYIPRSTPAVMTVEHHECLPQLHRWVKSGKVATPFNFLNIDEHHDFYHNSPPYDPDGTETCCGNWGFRVPLEWYNRYTWVHNGHGVFNNWSKTKAWFAARAIPYSARSSHRLSQIRTNFVAAVFSISPDYLDEDTMFPHVDKAVEIIASRFRLDVPVRSYNGGCDQLDAGVGSLDGWKNGPRRPSFTASAILSGQPRPRP